MKLRRLLTVAAAGLIAAIALSASAGEVMIQYFESKWETIEKKMPDAFVAGYGSYWLPPPGKGDTGGFSVGYDVYDRFNLGSAFDPTLYGTESSIRQMVKTAHGAGMRVYFDHIFNHNGFRDSSTAGFVASGDYPGFVTTLPGDVDGDFHGAYDGGDLNMRLAGLIDIAQEKNHVFIRQPAVAGAQNIPNESPNPLNARFYPDLQLPVNGAGFHPFNLGNPLAGDPVPENATGLLLRNAQWMIESIGADGFRIDAEKHVPTWFFSDYFDNTVYQRGRVDFNGNPTTPFSFGEVYTGDFGVLGAYRRKDGYGNRDVLDFPLFFKMRDVLNGNGFGDMRELEFASVDAIDGNANDGSAGVMFVQSHDNGGAALDNVAYAHILTRTGLPIVYFNAQEFGTDRPFPQGGRGDALGGDFGNLMPRLVDVSRRYAKGSCATRWIDSDIYVYERSNSLLVGLSDRMDSGYDQRTVATDFRNVTLTELSGAASDPNVNANGDFPQTITIGNDGLATIRVPRNRTNSTQHNRGFIMYGLETPAHTQTISPLASVLPADGPSVPNGVRRMTPLQVVTGTTFSVTVQTTGSIAEDNALIKLDGGLPIDANSGVFITAGEFAGFEQFTGLSSPRASSGTGTYQLTIDDSGLSEGLHFLETVAFLPRLAGLPPAYSSVRSAIYLDRTPPPVMLAFPSTTGTSDVVSQSYTVVAKCPDFTANSMHVFFDQPVNYDFLGNVNGSNQMTKVDRDEFRFTWNGITNGTHSITVVAFESTGRSNVVRFNPVGAAVPQPNMALGVDTDASNTTTNFQPMPATVSTRAYADEVVIRVDSTGGLLFPRDYDVYLDVDGQTYTAVAYNSSLLPPENRLVQNDQNLSDNFDEFRFVWRGYIRGTHQFQARAQLKSGNAPPNSVSALVTVPLTVTGPLLLIQSPSAGTTLNVPTSVTVTVASDFSTKYVQALISQPGGSTPFSIIGSTNNPGSPVTLSRSAGHYLLTDALNGLNLENGIYTIRAIAGTGLDGGGITSTVETTVSVTGMPTAPVISTPVIDGDIREFLDRSPLAVSACDGGGSGGTVSDFGPDGSLTELHGRIANGNLYLAVRGDLFNGGDPNNNATVVYIDVDSTSGTGAKRMGSPSDLSDTADALRSRITNSGFSLNAALQAQGIGFDAAVVIDGSNPVSAKIFGLGSGGVSGSASSFVELAGSFAFGRGFQTSPGATGTIIAGPSGFEVVIPLSLLGNANPLDMAFLAVTTSDSGFPSPNTLPENVQNTFDAAQVIDAVARFPKYPRLVLNEINNGTTDFVEIYNPTTSSVALTNWKLRWTDEIGVSGLLSVTSGTVPSLGYILAHDGSLAPTPPAGSVLLSSNISWEGSRAGSAGLIDPYGIAIDFVRWSSLTGQASSDSAPTGTRFTGSAVGFESANNRTLSRSAASTDTDTAGDWVVQVPTPGAVNPANSGVAEWTHY